MTVVLGMTIQQVLDNAKARCAELGVEFPATRSLLIDRISQTQQDVFAMGAQWNPDYFGTCIVGTLDGLAIDVLAILDPLEIPETITRIEIADPGSSEWSAGDEVSVVTLSDRDHATIPPRVTVRRKLISSVGTDLNGVNSLRIFYSPCPLPIDPAAVDVNTKRIEIPRPHDRIVALDLTLYLLDKIPNPTDAVTAGKAATQAELTAALAKFESHVRSYVMTTVSRFGSRPHAPPMRQNIPTVPTV